MTVLDAYAVLAYLREETAAEQVTELMLSPTVLSAVNATEVVDQLVRVYARDPDDVHACVAAATALDSGSPLATADPALAALVRDEGGSLHALPDRAGRVP